MNSLNARIARELLRIAKMMVALSPDMTSLINRVKSDPHDLIARNQLLSDKDCPATYLRQYAESRDLVAVRLVAANPSCPLELLNGFLNSSDPQVVKAAMSNPSLPSNIGSFDVAQAAGFYQDFKKNGYLAGEDVVDNINTCLRMGLYDDPEVLRDLYFRSKFDKKAILSCARMHGINDDEVTTMNGGFRKIIACCRDWSNANGATMSYNQQKYEIRINFGIEYQKAAFVPKEIPSELPPQTIARDRDGNPVVSQSALDKFVEKSCRMSARKGTHKCQILVRLSDCVADATVDGIQAASVNYRSDMDIYREGGFDEVVLPECQEAIGKTASEQERKEQADALFAQQKYRGELTAKLNELAAEAQHATEDENRFASSRRNRRVAMALVRLARSLVANDPPEDDFDKALELFEQGRDISDALEGKLTKELKKQGIDVTASLREHGIRLAADENPKSFFKKAIEKLKKKSGGLLTKAVLVGAILLTLSTTSCSVQDLKEDIKDCSSKVEAVEQQEEEKSDLELMCRGISEQDAKKLCKMGSGIHKLNGTSYAVGEARIPTTMQSVSAMNFAYDMAEMKAKGAYAEQNGGSFEQRQESVLQSVASGYGNGFCYEIYEVVGN